MKQILTITKKELRRFFGDKRLLFGLLLPGVLIFVIYTIMGLFMSGITSGKAEVYKVYIDNQASAYESINHSDAYNIKVLGKGDKTVDEIKSEIKDGKAHLYINYKGDFSGGGAEKPVIEFIYSQKSTESQTIYSYYYGALSQFQVDPSDYKFLIIPESADTDEDVMNMIVSMLLPYMLVIFLITGCLAAATESIAGEKERGTLATLLVTPVKRSSIAIGKILALSVTSLVSATSSFIGLIASLPRIMGNSAGAGEFAVKISVGGYFAIFAILITLVLLFTVILSIVSCFAKSVKEATQLATPVMIIVILTGITSFITMGKPVNNHFLYLIPVYNAVQIISSAITGALNGIDFLVTVAVNLALVGAGVAILAKMFDSEKIMFDK